MSDEIGNISQKPAVGERESVAELMRLMKSGVVKDEELHFNLSLFQRRQELSRTLFYDHLYQKLIGQHGYILEFGNRYGATLALLQSLRGIYEPYNFSRMIFGFDTFEGFAGSGEEDSNNAEGSTWKEGDYGVPRGYEETLENILEIHERFSPIPHIRKFGLYKGDVRETLPQFFDEHPETMIAMAIFDMDIYAPTKDALRQIRPRLHKGSILVFDELCCKWFPGETQAVMEELSMGELQFQRFPHQPFSAYTIL